MCSTKKEQLVHAKQTLIYSDLPVRWGVHTPPTASRSSHVTTTQVAVDFAEANPHRPSKHTITMALVPGLAPANP